MNYDIFWDKSDKCDVYYGMLKNGAVIFVAWGCDSLRMKNESGLYKLTCKLPGARYNYLGDYELKDVNEICEQELQQWLEDCDLGE